MLETAIIGSAIAIGGQVIGGIQADAAAKRSAAQQEKMANDVYMNQKKRLTGEDGLIANLHDQENAAYGTLISGAAASGVKVSQFDRPERMSAEEAIGAKDTYNQAVEDLKKAKRQRDASIDWEAPYKKSDPKDYIHKEQYQRDKKAAEDRERKVERLEAKVASAKEVYNSTGSVDMGEAGDTMEALRNKITHEYNVAEKNIYSDLDMARLGKENSLFNAKETRLAGEQAFWAGMAGAGSTLLTGIGKSQTPIKYGGWKSD